MKVLQVRGREVLDSRGNPTVECVITTKNGKFSAIVPSGASTGVHEALELRDKQKRYLGLGVLNAVKNISLIEKKIIGKDFDQNALDNFLLGLDGTRNKSNLGANAILAVSLAFCKASAANENISLYEHIAHLSENKKLLLPVPFMNILNGGKHADNGIPFQEFMIVPKAKSFSLALQYCSETYHILKTDIHKKYGKSATAVGDEGGFAPPLKTVEEALDIITDAIDDAGYSGKVRIALDSAASEFYRNGKYYVDGQELSAAELIEKYEELIKQYHLVSLEDPFDQEDFEHFAKFTKKTKIQIVGDDLLVTNPSRIRKALTFHACNALLLKVNQIGSLSEALDAAHMAKLHKWNVMVSHRSGDTEDTFISDLAVGLGCGQMKSGAPCRTERVAKYNQLLRIEEELGKKAVFHTFF